MEAMLSQENGETFVIVTQDGGTTKRMTLEEAHQYIEDEQDTAVTADCFAGRCMWCKVDAVLEGVR